MSPQDRITTYEETSLAVRCAIECAARVLVVSHANPDADSICSMLAFERGFASIDREITLAIGEGQIPATLGFLDGLSRIRRLDDVSVEAADLIVFLDCADQFRVERNGAGLDLPFATGTPVINIDHHVTNTNFGTINLVDAEAAATCEILAVLFEDLDIEITPEIATPLMAGIQGDTLGLRTPSTTSRTLLVSSRLLASGADLDTIVDYLFRLRPFSTLKLWGAAFERARLDGDVVWTEITPEMLVACGATASEGEGIVNFLAGTIGARVAALLYRESNGWRVSLRSLAEDVNVAVLAGRYGGGGHSRAAGLTINGDEADRDAFLRDIAESARPAATSTSTPT